MSRRSDLEIYLDVLLAINRGPRRPTRIMYEVNLSWKALKRILGRMTSSGFVREVHAGGDFDRRSNRLYEITPKGREVIRRITQADELLELMEVSSRVGA